MPDELTKALLLEEAASEGAIAEALFASVTGGVPLVEALVEARAVTSDVLGRYLARTEAPHLRQVVPLMEVMGKLPPGLCARLLAIPVRRDAITGTIDVVVADASDLHPGNEIAFHLDAPVRLVRASVAAIDEALRKLRMRSLPPVPPPESRPGPGTIPPPTRPDPTSRDDASMYDSRPRAREPLPQSFRGGTLPPPAPAFKPGMPAHLALDAMASHALRPSRVPTHERQQAHVVPATPAAQRLSRNTPPWGTPVLSAEPPVSEPPNSSTGSEIPIPLTRRTFAAVSGGTQRPPPLVNPAASPLGEGYAVDAAHFREVVEVNEPARSRGHTERVKGPPPNAPAPAPINSFIPGPPPMPGAGAFAAFAPQIPFADIGGILAALRAAGSRDEVLELVLTGARMVAFKVALFVAKRGGYLGWACTPEFGDRAAVQAILVPLDSGSVLDEAVRDGLYLGPIRHDEAHTPLLQVMRSASRDVAIVPIRVSGKTAVVLIADELGDTMLATRRLEELARAAGDAFARIVRMRR